MFESAVRWSLFGKTVLFLQGSTCLPQKLAGGLLPRWEAFPTRQKGGSEWLAGFHHSQMGHLRKVVLNNTYWRYFDLEEKFPVSAKILANFVKV